MPAIVPAANKSRHQRPANLAAAQANAFGVLRLTLKAAGYRWRWVSARGQPAFDDTSQGRVACVRATP